VRPRVKLAVLCLFCVLAIPLAAAVIFLDAVAVLFLSIFLWVTSP
jgi:hypothetical protein